MWFSWLLFSVGVHSCTPNDPTFVFLCRECAMVEEEGGSVRPQVEPELSKHATRRFVIQNFINTSRGGGAATICFTSLNTLAPLRGCI